MSSVLPRFVCTRRWPSLLVVDVLSGRTNLGARGYSGQAAGEHIDMPAHTSSERLRKAKPTICHRRMPSRPVTDDCLYLLYLDIEAY